MARRRASTSRLEPGEHSIDRSTPRQVDGQWWLDWSLRLHDDRILRRRSKGATEKIVRRRARRTAEKLLAATSTESATLERLAQEIADLSPGARETLLRMVQKMTDD